MAAIEQVADGQVEVEDDGEEEEEEEEEDDDGEVNPSLD